MNWFTLAFVAVLCNSTNATFSIAVADTVSKTVGVASFTCGPGFDLSNWLPVVKPAVGSALSQAWGDATGERRIVIRAGFDNGYTPQVINTNLQALDIEDTSPEDYQHGIVTTNPQHAPNTFTGDNNFGWAGGVAGTTGPLNYAIQGNVMTGDCVVLAVEEYVKENPTISVPELLMEALQIARDGGGDGRCSCGDGGSDLDKAQNCGCPPNQGKLTGNVALLIVALPTDLDSTECTTGGCAEGDYYMDLNVVDEEGIYVDPVDLIQFQFDKWWAAQFPDECTSRFSPELPIDYVGYGTTFDLDLNDCKSICCSMDCNAIQYSTAAALGPDSRCVVHSKGFEMLIASQFQDYITQFVDSQRETCEYNDGITNDIPGYGLGSSRAVSLANCKDMCCSIPGCVAVQYSTSAESHHQCVFQKSQEIIDAAFGRYITYLVT